MNQPSWRVWWPQSCGQYVTTRTVRKETHQLSAHWRSNWQVMATECVRIDENTQHTHKVENQWEQGEQERSEFPVEIERTDMQMRHLAHRHVVRTLTSTTSNTRLTKIDETLSDRKKKQTRTTTWMCLNCCQATAPFPRPFPLYWPLNFF